MGKITSLNGKVTGKIGAVVYSTNAGETIAREYNPNVANPNTEAQVNQRAKLKLMSQIAAALAPVIVIPKEGLKSSRNLFIKKNFGSCDAHDGVAQITYENVQLTSGNAGLPGIVVNRSQATGCTVHLEERCDAAIGRCVYIMYRKTSESTLQYVQSIIVENGGQDGTFPGTMLFMEGDLVFFAYGMKDLNSKASAKYADYSVTNGEDVARLVMARNINYGDYQFTQTRGTTLFAGENQSTQVGDNEGRVYVTASGPGTVAGAGVYTLGTEVTVTATPNAGCSFVGWKENGSEAILSTSTSYTFTLNGMRDLVAVFTQEAVAQTYTVTAAVSTHGEGTQGTVSGGGTVAAGSSVTVTATDPVSDAMPFLGWYINDQGSAVSASRSYTFIPNGNVNLFARWGTDTPGED